MSPAPSTVYLVTGANRGIGLGLVSHLAVIHPDAFIYAGVRDASKPSGLNDLEIKYPGRIEIVKCVSGDEEGNKALARMIKDKHGHVDTVIANAGIASIVGPALETSAAIFQDHFSVNAVGPIILFQAFHDLLKASSCPRFVPITTGAACIGTEFMAIPIGCSAYGASKAALNYVTRKIHFENEWLIAFPLAPGGVITDLMHYNLTLDHNGAFAKVLEGQVLTVEECATSLVSIIDGSRREKDGGEFLNVDGTKLPW